MTVPEVKSALLGKTEVAARINNEGETIVSVAVPIQYMMATRGALQLSTQGGDIDRVIASERWAIFRFFVVLASVMLVLSLSLANTIAEPVRRLATAAERVRRGIRSREQIPDFTSRTDEIGHLSRALREMTMALYSRLDAIESFAADVAHELKNPLTSLRSALETLPRVHADHSRDRLIAVMQHDVRRLDRLISDISDASRLDAELARGEASQVDVAALLRAVVAMSQDSPRANGTRIELSIESRRGRHPEADFLVVGHDSRLAQVVTNLIDNACSFSEPGGTVRVRLARAATVLGERAAGEVGGDHGRRRRPRRSSACARTDLRAFLHRPPESGIWAELRTRAVDLPTDRRSPRRKDLGDEPASDGGRRTRLDRSAGAGAPWRRRAIRGRIAGVYRMSSAANLGTGLHATAVVYGESGLIILGASGSGKSALALALLAQAKMTGRFGALIGDDRVWVRAACGRLVASGAPHMAGLIERRAAGLQSAPSEPAMVVRLIVELSGPNRSWPRWPAHPDVSTVEGVAVPRLALNSAASAVDNAISVGDRLELVANRGGGRGILLEQCAALHKNRRLATSRTVSTSEARAGRLMGI